MNSILPNGEEYPFEFHITVINADKNKFKLACSNLNVKAIIIHLQNNDGKVMFDDVMTSSRFFGNDDAAHTEMLRISDGLYEKGFHVVRKKMETTPYHPDAPSLKNGKSMGNGQYFESHIEVVIRKNMKLDLLRESLKNIPNVHISSNPFKVYEEHSVVMVTLRRYDVPWEEFKQLRDSLKMDITDIIISPTDASKFNISKMITEFAILDTCVKHDEKWINE